MRIAKRDPNLARAICSTIDPEAVAERVLSLSPGQGWAWGEFLVRLCSAYPGIRAKLAWALPVPACEKLLSKIAAIDLEDAYGILSGLGAIDDNLRFRLGLVYATFVSKTVSSDPVRGWDKVSDYVLFDLDLADFTTDGADQIDFAVGQEVARQLDARRVADAISTSTASDWPSLNRLLGFVKIADPRKRRQILRAVDIDRLRPAVVLALADPTDELDCLLAHLAFRENCEPAHSLLMAESAAVGKLSATLMRIAPLLAEGGFGVSGLALPKLRWELELVAGVCNRLAQYDRALAEAFVAANLDSIASGLEETDPWVVNGPSMTDIADLLVAVAAVSPSLVGALVGRMDPEETACSWSSGSDEAWDPDAPEDEREAAPASEPQGVTLRRVYPSAVGDEQPESWFSVSQRSALRRILTALDYAGPDGHALAAALRGRLLRERARHRRALRKWRQFHALGRQDQSRLRI